MRLIYLSHCLPFPPNKGDRVRAYHALRVLASRGHQIHLLALAKPGEDSADARSLAELCDRVEVFPVRSIPARVRSLRALLGSRPLTLAYFHSERLERRVRELDRTGEYDAVIAYSSAVIPYAQQLRRGPRLLDMVDVDSEKWAQYSSKSGFPRSWVFAKEAKRLRRVEERTADLFDGVVVATSREASLLASITGGATIGTIRNGVSSDFFAPGKTPKSEHPTLAFMGQMDYLPNVDAARYLAEGVLPHLQARFPNTRLLIIGRSPVSQVKRLARLRGVEVTGAVEDVRPFLARSWVFAAPLRVARGIQNKVLEAMAMGLPVVCSRGVLAGLGEGGFEEREDLLVGDSENELAEAVLQLFASREERQRMGEAARQRVQEVYDWDRNMAVMDLLLQDLASSRSPRPAAENGPVGREVKSVVE